ncbi:Protein of unknown function [Gryllus bimaculatus]|nr:Protein of unknown function [Gryllus bimaculatus]
MSASLLLKEPVDDEGVKERESQVLVAEAGCQARVRSAGAEELLRKLHTAHATARLRALGGVRPALAPASSPSPTPSPSPSPTPTPSSGSDATTAASIATVARQAGASEGELASAEASSRSEGQLSDGEVAALSVGEVPPVPRPPSSSASSAQEVSESVKPRHSSKTDEDYIYSEMEIKDTIYSTDEDMENTHTGMSFTNKT